MYDDTNSGGVAGIHSALPHCLESRKTFTETRELPKSSPSMVNRSGLLARPGFGAMLVIFGKE
jgi:hypothetical protein